MTQPPPMRVEESHGRIFGAPGIILRHWLAPFPLNRAGIPYEADSAENFFIGDYFQRFVDTLRILNDVDRAKLNECWRDFADASAIKTGFKFLRGIRGGFQPFSKILCEFCEKINFLDDAAEELDVRRMSLDGIKRILDDLMKSMAIISCQRASICC